MDHPKRLLLGRALRSDALRDTLLRKRIALPVFASDPLSSVAYAPGEVLLILSIAGLAAYHHSVWITVAVVILMITVVASYRQTVHAYPNGGGAYAVVSTNFGRRAGLMVGSALLVDYVLTVAVSVSAGVDNLGSAVGIVENNEITWALVVILALALMNLRGVKESGTFFAVPTYAFVVGVLLTVAWGGLKALMGDTMRAPSADFDIVPEQTDLSSLATAFLLLRAFSSGCAALTGVEAISNGVPAFREPKGRNAAGTLAIMGTLASVMFLGIMALALHTHVRVAEDPARDLIIDGEPAGHGFHQDPVIAQVGEAVFGNGSPAFYGLAAVTALILFLAANTAFSGFPVLGSILAQDRFLPRQLHTRGDRLAFSNGIVLLTLLAGLLVVAFRANVNQLIQLYIVGVFVSFTFSQTGMVKHWNHLLADERDQATRRRMHRARALNGFGAALCASVLVIVLLTKFTHGAWVSLVGMALFYAVMTGIRRHYDAVADELALDVPEEELDMRPSQVHAVVLVSQIHKPTMRALAYAKLLRSDSLVAVTIAVDPTDTRKLTSEWKQRHVDVPLTVLDAPYREITHPVVAYVKELRRAHPRDVVSVIIPEYVVGHWYEALLHNQSALRLKARLLLTPGVTVTSVPWQLASAENARRRLKRRHERHGPRGVRRGVRHGTHRP
ncbi:APC family permease [Streptomyces radicis]|uniref:APC family permease n=1 Tax=Streptomyces radicis TaxID=1750517 RepID=A0A3A9W0X6_9ACTN|nr:APC family permease [Streptomyces radicis]RKN06875.1 APC family permease [Streptomyces radicis]RKN19493.1 APC family permease [Streptomyces radicis]